MSRFYRVYAPHGKVTHMAETLTEGNPTYCKLRLQPGWKWFRPSSRRALPLPRCQRCEAA